MRALGATSPLLGATGPLLGATSPLLGANNPRPWEVPIPGFACVGNGLFGPGRGDGCITDFRKKCGKVRFSPKT